MIASDDEPIRTQIVYIYTSYTEAKKKSHERYRKSENGREKMREAQRRYYLNKKLRKNKDESLMNLVIL